jgi:hypothetical protein
MNEPATLTRGDLKPDAVITISDARDDADFSGLDVGQCMIIGEMDGEVVFGDPPDSVVPAGDGKSALVTRAWKTGDTDESGRMYVWVLVTWGATAPQHFPQDTPLIVDIRRAPGDS